MRFQQCRRLLRLLHGAFYLQRRGTVRSEDLSSRLRHQRLRRRPGAELRSAVLRQPRRRMSDGTELRARALHLRSQLHRPDVWAGRVRGHLWIVREGVPVRRLRQLRGEPGVILGRHRHPGHGRRAQRRRRDVGLARRRARPLRVPHHQRAADLHARGDRHLRAGVELGRGSDGFCPSEPLSSSRIANATSLGPRASATPDRCRSTCRPSSRVATRWAAATAAGPSRSGRSRWGAARRASGPSRGRSHPHRARAERLRSGQSDLPLFTRCSA